MADLFGLIEQRMALREIEGSRPNTIRTKRQILRAWSRHLGDRDITEATRADVLSFLGRPGLTANTRAQYLTTLRVFYGWAILEGHMAANPALEIKGPRCVPGLPRPVPVEHFRLALATAAPNVRTWLMLGAHAGLRCYEMAQLRGEDFDWETSTMLVHGKGGTSAIMPVHPALEEDLRSRTRRPGWLFPHRYRPGEHVLAGSISKLVNQHLRGLGIDSTAHALRHLFGTSVYQQSGHDIRLTQELMRHRSPATTAIYTKVDRVDAAKVVAKLKLLGLVAGAVSLLPSATEVLSGFETLLHATG